MFFLNDLKECNLFYLLTKPKSTMVKDVVPFYGYLFCIMLQKLNFLFIKKFWKVFFFFSLFI